MNAKTSLLELLGFSGCSGIQRCLLSPTAEGCYVDFPVDCAVPPHHREEFFWLATFFARLDLSSCLLDLVAKSEGNSLCVTSSSGAEYHCKSSFLTKDSANILVFQGAEFSFYVVQGVTACDCIFVPIYGLMIEVAPSHVREIDRNGDVFHELSIFLAQNTCRSVVDWSGVIVGHRRPAHFFYDCLAGMEQCFGGGRHVIKHCAQYLLFVEGSEFWDLASVYPSLSRAEIIRFDIDRTNLFSQQQRVGFIKIGVQFKSRTTDLCRPLLRSADQRLREHIACMTFHAESPVSRARELKQRGSFVVWFGVATTKRIFIDQEEFIAHLVLYLSRLKGDICVLVDGWTQPQTSLVSDAVFIEDERRIVGRIQERLAGQADVVDLVGLRAQEKAAMSLLIDFYVAPCGTASLWPSRFARRPGLLHTSEAYYTNSIAAQIYSTGSSLYPVEAALPIVSRGDTGPALYFLSIALLMDWLGKEFRGLFHSQRSDVGVSRDAILVHVENASSMGKSWCFETNAESRFVFKLNEPMSSDRPSVLSMCLSLTEPSSGDEVIVLARTADGRVLSRMRFDVEEHSVQNKQPFSRSEVHLTFSVPISASRLVVRPRQSTGVISFESLSLIS